MKRSDFLPVVFCLCILAAPAQAWAQDYPNLPPVTPAEISMKDKPDASVGAAMILYYAVDTDNNKTMETRSMRIKIFDEDGKKYGDIRIPYLEKYSHIDELHARTIGPDGTVREFTGQIYDRDIYKFKKFAYHAKVLALPDVQVGSIVEYTYQVHFKGKVPDEFRNARHYIYPVGETYPAADWEVQSELFLKHGKFTLTPVKGGKIGVFTYGLPSGMRPTARDNGTRVQLDVDNVPAFHEEENAPPEATLKSRANLYYAEGFTDTDHYWLTVVMEWAKEYDKYIGNSAAVNAEAHRIVSPGDSPETRLRKLYARVQEIRQLGYENEKTDKEKKQEHLTENKNIEEVLKRGYGYGHDVDLLFVGLARAAGIEAYPVLLASRRTSYFEKTYPNAEQLNAMVVYVNIGQAVYLDPESRYCPYGLLPWSETSTSGVVMSVARGIFTDTPTSASTEAVTRLTAELQLSAEGTLKGKVRSVYEGQDALILRQWGMSADETERRNYLIEALKGALPDGATVNLVRAEGWEKTGEPLSTEFEVEIQSYAKSTGRRLILPVGVLHTKEQNPFASARRTYPIYFDYPYETYEDVQIELPDGFQVEGLPGPQKTDQKALFYELEVKQEGNILTVKRTRRMNSILFAAGDYGPVSYHYGKLLTADSQQAILKQHELAKAK